MAIIIETLNAAAVTDSDKQAQIRHRMRTTENRSKLIDRSVRLDLELRVFYDSDPHVPEEVAGAYAGFAIAIYEELVLVSPSIAEVLQRQAAIAFRIPLTELEGLSQAIESGSAWQVASIIMDVVL